MCSTCPFGKKIISGRIKSSGGRGGGNKRNEILHGEKILRGENVLHRDKILCRDEILRSSIESAGAPGRNGTDLMMQDLIVL